MEHLIDGVIVGHTNKREREREHKRQRDKEIDMLLHCVDHHPIRM